MDTRNMILLLLPLGLQLFGLSFAVLTDRYLRQKQRRGMLLIAGLVLALVAQNLLGWRLAQGTRILARTLCSIAGYSIRPLILLLFLRVVSERRGRKFGWALVLLNFAVHLTALFSPLCFTITEENRFSRGPLGYTCHVISLVLLIQLLYVTISYLTAAMVSCCVFYYIWLHQQFVRRHERDLMAEQRIQIMMTQIQPHFLYNTLSTIQVLCSVDPQQAAAVTGKFSVYLRQNLDSLEFPGMTTFEKELEHTRTYADIERVRFPHIRVEYAIEDSGFSLPPLTVQPIVENAIRHGVRIREEGVVRVEAHKTAGGHEIVIADNGVGFDTAAAKRDDGTHIGLRNVQERIERMCGGSVTVESRPGEGTTVTIFIPEGEKEGRA